MNPAHTRRNTPAGCRCWNVGGVLRRIGALNGSLRSAKEEQPVLHDGPAERFPKLVSFRPSSAALRLRRGVFLAEPGELLTILNVSGVPPFVGLLFMIATLGRAACTRTGFPAKSVPWRDVL